MNAARKPPLSPYRHDDLACARHVVTHAQVLSLQGDTERQAILQLAFGILSKDHALRNGRMPGESHGPAEVLPFPSERTRAWHRNRRRTPLLVLLPQNPDHPGDAA